MPRHSTYDVVLDTSLFTPLQLQTTAVGRLAFQAGTRWLRDHLCSHRVLLTEHRVGLVLWNLQLDYERPLRFHDADELALDVTARVRGPLASQLDMTMTLTGPAGVAVRAQATSVPLQLGGDAALSGAPRGLPPTLVAAFQDDEVERSVHLSPVRTLRSELERDGQELGRNSTQWTIHRHHCEVADQWYWVETLGLAGAGREELVRRHGNTAPELRRGLTEGLRRVDVTWLRAGQLWDRLELETVAYRHGSGLVFCHELRVADDPRGGPYAIFLERL